MVCFQSSVSIYSSFTTILAFYFKSHTDEYTGVLDRLLLKRWRHSNKFTTFIHQSVVQSCTWLWPSPICLSLSKRWQPEACCVSHKNTVMLQIVSTVFLLLITILFSHKHLLTRRTAFQDFLAKWRIYPHLASEGRCRPCLGLGSDQSEPHSGLNWAHSPTCVTQGGHIVTKYNSDIDLRSNSLVLCVAGTRMCESDDDWSVLVRGSCVFTVELIA